MQSQLETIDLRPAAPDAPSRSTNWWLDVRRAKSTSGMSAEMTDLTERFLAARPAACTRPALAVDLSFPADRIDEACQVLEILEADGYQVSADQDDWLPDGTKAVMIWWKLGAQDQAKALFERLRTIESLTVKLADEPSVPQMAGDIQVALGRDA